MFATCSKKSLFLFLLCVRTLTTRSLSTCVCCIMRTYYAVYIYYYTYDITWYAFEAWTWTALEADLGVMCASAPALRVFFRRYFGPSTDRSVSTSRRNTRPGWKARAWKPPGWKADPALKLHSGGGDPNIDLVPLSGITVSTCHYLRSEERRDGHVVSGGSRGSTWNLTALPRA